MNAITVMMMKMMNGYGRTGRNGPAPAGSTTPPDNGLFLKGAAPKVQVN